jgi:molecular chaperone GrpE
MSNEDSTDPKAPNATEAASTPEATPDPVAALTAERDKFRDAALRAMADLDNYRKRARKDSEEASRKAKEDVIRELLPVFDNLERALQYTSSSTDPKAITKGIEMVLRLFEDTIGKLGAKRLRTIGQPFDPSQHDAIQQIHHEEHPAGIVAHEELAGYVLNDRLLRPAMVVVSKGPAEGSSGGGSTPQN